MIMNNSRLAAVMLQLFPMFKGEEVTTIDFRALIAKKHLVVAAIRDLGQEDSAVVFQEGVLKKLSLVHKIELSSKIEYIKLNSTNEEIWNWFSRTFLSIELNSQEFQRVLVTATDVTILYSRVGRGSKVVTIAEQDAIHSLKCRFEDSKSGHFHVSLLDLQAMFSILTEQLSSPVPVKKGEGHWMEVISQRIEANLVTSLNYLQDFCF